MKTISEGFHIVPKGATYREEGQKLFVTLENGKEYCFLPGAIVYSAEYLDSMEEHRPW